MQGFDINMFSLDGKVALVTGGATGMGKSFAYALSKLGANIVVTSHSNSADKTKELVQSSGKEILVINNVDIRNSLDRKKIVEDSINKFGKIDILVNNAGTIRRSPILEHPDEYFEEVIDVNLKSIYYLSRDVAKVMDKNGGGKIINIASMLSFQGGKFVPGYTSSKHALAGLTKSFCNELAKKNIQVNAVAPGYVRTDNTKPILDNEERFREISARIPIGRWAEPLDIAGTVCFLASSASDYINGAVIPVDGGWLAS